MKLVDTSTWIQALRRQGEPITRERARLLVTSGQAVWCPIVRVELWAGVGKNHERQMLREVEQRIPELAINDEVWDLACELADRCRKAGKRVPPNDLIIEACARFHGVEVDAADAHFDFLKTL
jgi:predicted nucleic acid-binding protein